MVKQNQFIMALLLLFIILTFSSEVEGTKLFVFGDSYVDTGNFIHSQSYKQPYGMTYPGLPAGRFSDGRILTDYLASNLKIETPTAYEMRNSSNLQNGINFAYGGTGVFQTLVDGPNLTVQIDSFEQLINQNVYNKSEIQASTVLVNTGANDYTKFILKDKNIFKLPEFRESLIAELFDNLVHLHFLGADKIVVPLLQPLGCLPTISVATVYSECIDLINSVSREHNKMIVENLEKMNQLFGKPVYKTLDLYSSFLTAIQKSKENSTLMNPLEPCCALGSVGYDCGKVDDKGNIEYSVCDNPQLSFFWDNVHPSQNGWFSIFKELEPSLGEIL